MRIPVLLIAGLIAFGPVVHAAEAPTDNAASAEAPAPGTAPGTPPTEVPAPATVPPGTPPAEVPAPAPSPIGRENAGPGATTGAVGAPSDNVAPAGSPAPAPPPFGQENAAPGTMRDVIGAPAIPAPAAAPIAAPTPGPSAAPAVSPAPSMVPVAQSPTYLSIDFTDVELPVLIKFMSEQTKKNFIFDERVQGKITIISPRRVTLEEAYDVFLLVLQTKGFTTVTQGNTTRIIVAREARQDPIRTGVSKDTPSAEFITRLVPLQYLESAEVVPLVTPLISKDGMVSAFGSSNTLLLIDSRANIDRIVKILGEVDTEGAPATLQIYPLSFAVAADVAKTLNSIFLEGPPAAAAQAARGRARTGAIRTSRHIAVKFLADARTNSLIVHAGQDMQDDVADVLKKIDVPASAGGGKINVYYLENADAEEVSKVLASLSPEKRAGAPTPAPGARTPPATTGGAIVSAELEGGVKVTADKATNALIIVASANDYETLLGVIKRLDIRRRQVFVEAVIMEIDVGKSLDVGVEWRGAAQVGEGPAGPSSGARTTASRGDSTTCWPGSPRETRLPSPVRGSSPAGSAEASPCRTERRSPPSQPSSGHPRETTT